MKSIVADEELGLLQGGRQVDIHRPGSESATYLRTRGGIVAQEVGPGSGGGGSSDMGWVEGPHWAVICSEGGQVEVGRVCALERSRLADMVRGRADKAEVRGVGAHMEQRAWGD